MVVVKLYNNSESKSTKNEPTVLTATLGEHVQRNRQSAPRSSPLTIQLILEPQPQPHDHLALESYDRLALEPHDHCNLSLALNTSASQEGPSPQLRPSCKLSPIPAEPPIPFHVRHLPIRPSYSSCDTLHCGGTA